ncbi:hypothetical protein [Niabella ginsengisoli]|uniref:DUF2130 domain-containing protein n=1 Tax=Niabella ginsengisoli TaxID=522298 RepID=A0ABS9SJP8_9BACT|nr:hypothetical protein [Niabella ginsengisoli]MCH5598541.1 hypothetical protein [Niabella ginsengisoli]
MSTKIKCPNCSNEFEPNEAIREEVEKELRAKITDWQKKKTEEHLSELQKKNRNGRTNYSWRNLHCRNNWKNS